MKSERNKPLAFNFCILLKVHIQKSHEIVIVLLRFVLFLCYIILINPK